MSTAHTPGPWRVGEEFKERCGGLVLYGRPISGGGKAIARVWSGSERRLLELPDDEANARLIAAAPAMREALLYVEEQLASFKPDKLAGLGLEVALEQVRAALAAAQGEDR